MKTQFSETAENFLALAGEANEKDAVLRDAFVQDVADDVRLMGYDCEIVTDGVKVKEPSDWYQRAYESFSTWLKKTLGGKQELESCEGGVIILI